MTLGILIYSLGGGGAERVASYLLSHIDTGQIEVHLFLMNETIVYSIPKGIHIHYLEKSKPTESGVLKLLKVPILAYRYKNLCKKLGVSHSFSLMTRPNYINILSGIFNSKIKILISERAYPSLQYGYGDVKSKLNKILIKSLYRKADKVICNSIGNSEDLGRNFNVPRESLHVIYNPIDLEKIKKIVPIHEYFSEKYINLITIGRLDRGKNHRMLIEAIKGSKNLRLYIIGDGELRNELQKMISDESLENNVFLVGFSDNPFKYLKSADLFVFGSNHEGFPNVLLEAMACGLPIISTNCMAGPSEIMEVKKEKSDEIMSSNYGMLVPIQNVDLMRHAILTMIQDRNFKIQIFKSATFPYFRF